MLPRLTEGTHDVLLRYVELLSMASVLDDR